MQFLLFLLKLYLLGTLRYPASTSTRHKFSLYNLKTFAKHAFPAWQCPVEMIKSFGSENLARGPENIT